jgi:putative ABC transport system ATP-binding protein
MQLVDIPHSVLNPSPSNEVLPTVNASGLQHFFGEGELRKQVLYDANLVVRPGEIIIMTGPSGSGKTTLLTLIGTLRRVQEGSLVALGKDLKSASDAGLNSVRKKIGFIFQAHNLFDSLTATQNVRMALELAQPHNSMSTNTKIAQEMLKAVGLGHRLNHKPKQLSGGQKQRVAIARGLVHQPRLVLADEPTAALDEESGRQVVDLFQHMAKEQGTTIILVTHDNRILDVADRIVNLIDGRIKSDIMVREAANISRMLAACSVFAGITPRNLVSIADQMKTMKAETGDTIIRQGDAGDRFFLVRTGRVQIVRDDQNIVAELGEGDHFGETALLTGQPRNATVKALEPSSLYYLDKSDFQAAMAKSVTLEEEVRYSVFDR